MKVSFFRKQNCESSHSVSAVACTAQGEILWTSSQNDEKRHLYPRSAIKMLQSLPLFTSGADKKFSLSPQEVALSCASHSGQERHINLIQAWLDRIGCTVGDLKCGTHWPYDFQSSCLLARNNEVPSALHNNCSGKHTGFLTLARTVDADPLQYFEYHHAVQKLVRSALSEICQFDFDLAPWGVDGCGIPTYFVPLLAFANGLARFSLRTLTDGTPESTIYQSFRRFPELTSGTNEVSYSLMQIFPNLIIKTGAEGVLVACIPRRQCAVVVKAKDGAARAAHHAMVHVLEKIGIQPSSPFDRSITNRNGQTVGYVEVDSE